MATYKSISCELLAEAAVRPEIPIGTFLRLTPHAAQRRFESTCNESFLPPISRIVLLCCNALSTDLPRASVGRGNVIDGIFGEVVEPFLTEVALCLLFLSIIDPLLLTCLSSGRWNATVCQAIQRQPTCPVPIAPTSSTDRLSAAC